LANFDFTILVTLKSLDLIVNVSLSVTKFGNFNNLLTRLTLIFTKISWKQRFIKEVATKVDFTKYFFSEGKFLNFPHCVCLLMTLIWDDKMLISSFWCMHDQWFNEPFGWSLNNFAYFVNVAQLFNGTCLQLHSVKFTKIYSFFEEIPWNQFR